MPTSFYDFSVVYYLQTLTAIEGVLEKGRVHCEANGIGDVVGTRLYPDMLPFQFQIVSVCHHSLGAIKGVQAGVFSPPPAVPELDYAGLTRMVGDAHARLKEFTAEVVNAFAGKEVIFRVGERSLPFVAENFILSFSLPNFYFHAATTYDILRMKGVPLGKRDFMGPLRMKSA